MVKNFKCSLAAIIVIVMYGWFYNVGDADMLSMRIITFPHHAGCKALESDSKFCHSLKLLHWFSHHQQYKPTSVESPSLSET